MGDTSTKKKNQINLKEPKLYKVFLLNDDYTTMQFVVEIIMNIFGKNEEEAVKIMYEVHQQGKGMVGIYPYDIAFTKIIQVETISKENQFPLKAVLEEE